MFSLVLEAGGFLFGALLGHHLARKGLTANTALQGRQFPAAIVVILAGSLAGLFYFRQHFRWMPVMPLLYGEAWLMPGVAILTGFALGTTLFLEWPGRHDRRRRRSMIFASIALALCLGYVVRQAMPITSRLGPSAIVDGVVLQTTPYTCAPSTIATLVRYVLGDTTATERSASLLSRTTRGGTNTLAEIRAMRRLGLDPRFSHRLTMDSLVAYGPAALLHVDEPVGAGVTIRHAVALLDVNADSGTVTIGNPLYGIQVKQLEELEGYWLGEAVLVGPRAGEDGEG